MANISYTSYTSIYRRRHGENPPVEFIFDLAFELINTNKETYFSVGRKRGRSACTTYLIDATLLTICAPMKGRARKSHVPLDSSIAIWPSWSLFSYSWETAVQDLRQQGSVVAMYRLKCNCHLCVTKDRNCFLKFHTSDAWFMDGINYVRS